jgi:hypothetical protein
MQKYIFYKLATPSTSEAFPTQIFSRISYSEVILWDCPKKIFMFLNTYQLSGLEIPVNRVTKIETNKLNPSEDEIATSEYGAIEPSGFSPGVSLRELRELLGGLPELELLCL